MKKLPFTPTFSFTNGNGNHTVSGAVGRYVKVGGLVNIQGYIKLATKGTANGVIRIANIPFINIAGVYVAGSVWMNTMQSGQPMDGDFTQYLIINGGGDHMRLWCLSGNGAVHEATRFNMLKTKVILCLVLHIDIHNRKDR